MNYSFKTALNKSDRGGWVRLLTLTYLRWIAIIGQTFAVIIGFYFLKLDFSIFNTFIFNFKLVMLVFFSKN
jgi:hypothetical protein